MSKKKKPIKTKEKGIVISNIEDFFLDLVLEQVKEHKEEEKRLKKG